MKSYKVLEIILLFISLLTPIIQTNRKPSTESFTKNIILSKSSKSLKCSLFKAVMDQYSFHQYIEYEQHMPQLNEFTLCVWHKMYNRTLNYPIFTYSTANQPQSIYSWIKNTPRKSYYILVVNGHTIYSVNYPIKVNFWHHMCQSWNGKSGEWQLWIDGERAGRGYYNLMVGKIIYSGGVSISGQENMPTFKMKGWIPNKVREGLRGEVTLLQLYRVALSRGKAYSNHKHHHVYEWDHNGNPMNDYGDSIANVDDEYDDDETFSASEEVFNFHPQTSILDHFKLAKLSLDLTKIRPHFLKQVNLDTSTLIDTFKLFKRRQLDHVKLFGGENDEDDDEYHDGDDETILTSFPHQQEEEVKHTIEYELAGWEVKKIGQMCNGCEEDPFKEVNVISWQKTYKRLFSDAEYILATPECYEF